MVNIYPYLAGQAYTGQTIDASNYYKFKCNVYKDGKYLCKLDSHELSLAMVQDIINGNIRTVLEQVAEDYLKKHQLIQSAINSL